MAYSIAAVDIKSPYKRSPMKWYQAVGPSACVSADPTGRITLILNLLIFVESDEKFRIWLKPGKKYQAFYVKS